MNGFPFLDDPIQVGSLQLTPHIFVIGEIGINHNGDLELAKQLIDMAKGAGCDAVKFQKRDIDVVYTQPFLAGLRESPWGKTQRDQKAGLEFSADDYDVIQDYCARVGIQWFVSAWDPGSQIFMRRYDLPYNKIASAMVTHSELVTLVAEEQKPTFISTGMCSWEEIDQVVAIFRQKSCPFMLMHTVSEYPAPLANLNLGMIPVLRERYNCPVGYSGHEGSVSPSVMAGILGASAIERHITLDRAMYGSDQAASLQRQGIESLVEQLRKIPLVMGDGVRRITATEMEVAKKLRYWRPAVD